MTITAHYVTGDDFNEIVASAFLFPNHTIDKIDIDPGIDNTFESLVEELWDFFIQHFNYSEEIAEEMTNSVVMHIPNEFTYHDVLHIKAFKIPSHLYFTLSY